MQNQNGGAGQRPTRGNGIPGNPAVNRNSASGNSPANRSTAPGNIPVNRNGAVQNLSRNTPPPQKPISRSPGQTAQNGRTAAPPSRPAQQQRSAPNAPVSRNPSNGYRSAAPYTVPPRQSRERVPYPTREAYLKRKQKERRRKRLTVLGLLAAVVLLIFLLLFFAVRALVHSYREQHGNPAADTDTVESLEANTGESGQAETSPAETEPLPAYDAVHALRGAPLLPYVSQNTVTLGTELGSPYAVFLDAQTGEVLAQKFEEKTSAAASDGTETETAAPDVLHARIYPASMTKLMTMLVAYEQCENLDDTFRMTYDIINPLYLSELALAGFTGGEDVTVRDLLYGAALPSGAEAAMGLALYTSGDEKTFVSLMNDRARLLGMKGTHFTNCTGLHDINHYSTLTDIAVLIAYMEQEPALAEILSAYQYTTSVTPQHPEGLLLTSTVFSRMEGNESGVCEIIGGKTGYTAEAQQCLAVYGIRKDTHHPFAAVFAGADTKWKPVYDAIYFYQFYTGDPPADDTQSAEEAPG